MQVIRVVNWQKFQSLKTSHPPWIKLYTKLLRKPAYIALSHAARGQLTVLWLLAAETGNSTPFDMRTLSRMFGSRQRFELSELIEAGFILICDDSAISDVAKGFSDVRNEFVLSSGNIQKPRVATNNHQLSREKETEETLSSTENNSARVEKNLSQKQESKPRADSKSKSKESKSKAPSKRSKRGPEMPEKLTAKEKSALFEDAWLLYPRRDGKKAAKRHFDATVHTQKQADDLLRALANYVGSRRVKRGFVKLGSTWFNNWQDWIAGDIDVQNPTKQDDRISEFEENLRKRGLL